MPETAAPLFTLATQTLQAETRRTDLTIRAVDEAACHEVGQRWQELAARQPQLKEHEDRNIAYLMKSLSGQSSQPPSFGLWHNDSLIATTLLDIGYYKYKGVLTVAHIAGSPEPHALKGCLLGTLHRVFAAMAAARGDEWVRYIGTYSDGSMKQFERGAVPLSQLARQRMWEGYNIDVAITPRQDELMHVPNSAPPLKVVRSYHGVYQQLFGHKYKPPGQS